jgi:hypothetical protein
MSLRRKIEHFEVKKTLQGGQFNTPKKTSCVPYYMYYKQCDRKHVIERPA